MIKMTLSQPEIKMKIAPAKVVYTGDMQSQYILGQLGRYYQNPPCNPCGCGG